MKLSTILKVLLVLVVLVIGGAAVFIATLDVNQYKDRIANALAEATGRDVTLAGPIDLSLGLSPALVVEDVTIGNAEWASDPHMAEVGRLEAQVEVLPLLQGTLKVVRLVLADASVALETNAEGDGNWSFGGPAEPSEAPAPSEDGGAMTMAFQELALKNASLTYRDGGTGQTMRAALSQATLTGTDFESPLKIDAAGTYNDLDFTLSGSLGALSAVTTPSATPWPLDLTATAGGATVTVAGTVANMAAAGGLDLTVTADGAQLQDLSTLARAAGQSVDVPALGPYTVRFQLSGDADALSLSALDATVGETGALRLSASGAIANVLTQTGLALDVALDAPDPAALEPFGVAVPVPVSASASVADVEGGYSLEAIQARLGRSTLNGALQVFLADPRPAVLGDLSAPLLDLNELAPGGGGGDGNAGDSQTAGGDGRVIPDTPLPLDALQAADADIRINVEKAILPGGAEVSALDLGVTLAGGALALNPLAAQVAGGSMSGTAVLEPAGNGAATLVLDLSGDGISLGDVAATFGNSDAIKGGPSTLRVALRGQGATPRQIAGTLNGTVLLHTTDAVINNGAVNWAGGDVITQIGDTINPFSDRESTTPLQCLVVNLTATNGVLANNHGLAFETDRMVVGGGGAFDLRTEQLNLKIAPRPRPDIGIETGLGKIVQLFAVIGSFANPHLEMDAQAAIETGLRTAASAAGAVATGGLSLLGENLAGNLLGMGDDGEMEPCLVALGQKEPGQIGSTDDDGTSSVGDDIGDAAEGAASAIDDAVGGLVGGILGNDGTSGSDTTPETPTDSTGTTEGQSEEPDAIDALQEGLGGLFGD